MNEVQISVTASNDTNMGFDSALAAIRKVRAEVGLLKRDLNDLSANVKVNMDRSLASAMRSASGDKGSIAKLLGKIPGVGGGLSGLAGLFGSGGVISTGLQGIGIGANLAGSIGQSGGGLGFVALLGAALATVTTLASVVASALVTMFGGAFTAIGVMAAMKLKPVKAAFADLGGIWQRTVTGMGQAFAPALEAFAKAAGQTLLALRPAMQGFAFTVSPAIQAFGTVLARSFGSPAVQEAISQLGAAFALLVRSLTPQIPGIVRALADGLSGMAQAITAHPGMIRVMGDILGFLLKLPGYALGALGSMTRLTNWMFTGMPHDISIGVDISRKWIEGFWHDTAKTFDDMRHEVATTWDDMWQSTIGATIRSIKADVGLFEKFPGQVFASMKGFGHDMWQFGAFVFGQLWDGLKAIGADIWRWLTDWVNALPTWLKHLLGIHSPSGVFYDIGKNMMMGLFNGIKDHANAAKEAAMNPFTIVPNIAAGFFSKLFHQLGSGGGGSIQSLMEAMAAGVGWVGPQWAALNAVEMREAGYNLHAVNPGSGAYGLAQFINGPGEYFQYGGNPYTAAGQITGMLNYIAQRYGNPENAWAHESAFGWYDQGGWLPPGLSLALNKTGRPERVIGPGQGCGCNHPIVLKFTGPVEKIFGDLISKMVMTRGGGDVQTAFGLR